MNISNLKAETFIGFEQYKYAYTFKGVQLQKRIIVNLFYYQTTAKRPQSQFCEKKLLKRGRKIWIVN
jgi:hypothetical protein